MARFLQANHGAEIVVLEGNRLGTRLSREGSEFDLSALFSREASLDLSRPTKIYFRGRERRKNGIFLLDCYGYLSLPGTSIQGDGRRLVRLDRERLAERKLAIGSKFAYKENGTLILITGIKEIFVTNDESYKPEHLKRTGYRRYRIIEEVSGDALVRQSDQGALLRE